MAQADERFDPYAILAGLERNYVDYVAIGGLARVLRGTSEVTRGVDICPSVAENNVERLNQAVHELQGGPVDREPNLDAQSLVAQELVSLAIGAGELNVIAAPVGVPNGFADLRRARRASTSVTVSDRSSLRPPT